MMELIRDLLDKQVVDRNNVKIGKVDGILAETQPAGRLKIVAIELGGLTLSRRLGTRLGRWFGWLISRLRGVSRTEPHRIPWNLVEHVGLEVKVGVDVRDTSIMRWQDWLRARFIGRIPGA